MVFSVADLATEVSISCKNMHNKMGGDRGTAHLDGGHSNVAIPRMRTHGGARRNTMTASESRVAVLAAASLLSGCFFGFMFGYLKLEEESMYHIVFALQREAIYTYPVGALIGGVSALLNQIIGDSTQSADDRRVAIMLRSATDDL